MNNFIKILDIKINTNSEEEILEKIKKYIKKVKYLTKKNSLKKEKPLIIFTPNPEIVMFAQKYPFFKKTINSSQINIPDGIGLIWAAKIIGYPIEKRITGVDLAEKLIFLAEKHQVSIGLIGGFHNLALNTLKCLKKRFPNLYGWAEDGPIIDLKPKKSKLEITHKNWQMNNFISKTTENRTGLLFVGFGCPKQELFIDKIASSLNNIVIIAVGGAFNYLSGKTSRAPKFIQNLGLEWFYRLVNQPWRIKRQIVLFKFLITVLLDKIKRLINSSK